MKISVLLSFGLLILTAQAGLAAELTGIAEVSDTPGNLTGMEADYYSLTFIDQSGVHYAVTVDDQGDFYTENSILESRMVLNNRKVTIVGDVNMTNGNVIAFQSATLIDEPSLSGAIHTHFFGSPTISLNDGRVITLAPGKFANLSSLNKKTCVVQGQFVFNGDNFYSVDDASCNN